MQDHTLAKPPGRQGGAGGARRHRQPPGPQPRRSGRHKLDHHAGAAVAIHGAGKPVVAGGAEGEGDGAAVGRRRQLLQRRRVGEGLRRVQEASVGAAEGGCRPGALTWPAGRRGQRARAGKASDTRSPAPQLAFTHLGAGARGDAVHAVELGPLKAHRVAHLQGRAGRRAGVGVQRRVPPSALLQQAHARACCRAGGAAPRPRSAAPHLDVARPKGRHVAAGQGPGADDDHPARLGRGRGGRGAGWEAS